MKKNLNERGFHLVMIPLLVVIVGIIGFAGWYVWNANKKTDVVLNDSTKTTNPVKITPTPMSTPTPSNKISLSITDYLWGKIDFQAPEGWYKLSEDGTQIFKTIDGIKYEILFDVQTEDQLKNTSAAMNSNEIEATTVTAKGTNMYIVKFNNDELIGLSSCKPESKKGCSIKQGDNYLLIYAASIDPEGGPGSIDFTQPSADTLINDVQEIASTLSL
jgi:hypothetical protein